MKRIILCLLLSYIGIQSYAQMMKNEISISSSSIWSKYDPSFYSKDEGWSNGIDINYSHNIYKNFFATGGIGINKQNFNVKRFFNYPSPVFIAFTTNYYYYENAQWLAGLGYDYKIHKHFGIKAKMIYSQSYSFKQYYQPNPMALPAYVAHSKYRFGYSIITRFSGYYYLSKRFYLGVDAIIPTITKWHNDAIFNEAPSGYFSPENSLGFGISINYHF